GPTPQPLEGKMEQPALTTSPAVPSATPPAVPPASAELVRVVPKHHGLVRLTHWANVPLLLGLIASGLAIYWAAPVLKHRYDPAPRRGDYLVDLGLAVSRLLDDRAGNPRLWVYDHLS